MCLKLSSLFCLTRTNSLFPEDHWKRLNRREGVVMVDVVVKTVEAILMRRKTRQQSCSAGLHQPHQF